MPRKDWPYTLLGQENENNVKKQKHRSENKLLFEYVSLYQLTFRLKKKYLHRGNIPPWPKQLYIGG